MFHLIVTCVGSKKYPGPSISKTIELLVGDGRADDLKSLHASWKNALSNDNLSRVRAADLYAGSLWSASNGAFQEILGKKHLWVMSCGYGLISYQDRISGYHATFKKYEDDSIFNRAYFKSMKVGDVKRGWWDMLTSQQKTGTGPRSIHDLVNCSEPDDIVMIVAGKDYHEAIYNDLAKIDLGKPLPTLVIVGIKKSSYGFEPKIPKKLESFVIPYYDGSELMRFLKVKLGSCNKVQLNSKFATWLIREYNRAGAFPKETEILKEDER